MYAVPIRELPEGPQWTYEGKLDGYRCLTSTSKGAVALWSRRGLPFNTRFPEIAKACQKLPPDTVIDGEVIAIDGNGKVSFNALQHHRTNATLQYYVFDLLMFRGKKTIHMPLDKRRTLLAEALDGARYPIIRAQSFMAKPADLIRAAKELELEGVVAKHNDSFYQPGQRSHHWLKFKLNRCQEFVVAGYTPGNPFDALIIGYYDAGKLLYASKVRNGFVPVVRRQVATRLKDLRTYACPFANLPEKKRTQWALTREEMKSCIWLKPERVVQIEFTEWTPDGHLRHAAFAGFREDKHPRDVVRES